jgi:hypothetical protein
METQGGTEPNHNLPQRSSAELSQIKTPIPAKPSG